VDPATPFEDEPRGQARHDAAVMSLGAGGWPVHAGMFVGRGDELARLRALWAVASRGTTQLAVVRGEPGVGKTALASALASEVIANGDLALYGRCDERVGLPYQPFVEVVRALAEARPDALTALPVNSCSSLAQLMPDLLAPPLPDSDIDPSVDRHQLLRTVADLLRGQAASGPVVVVLDDLQWASTATLLLLRHLVRDAEPAPLLLIALHRSTDLDPRHALFEVLTELQATGAVTRLTLEGLGEDDVRRFVEVAGVSSGESAATLARRLVVRTSGNPFFVGELLANLAETGAPDGDLPASVREVVTARVDRLSDAARELLQVLAARGRASGTFLLSQVVGVAEDDALDALDEVLAAGLLTETGSGEVAFSHDLVRDVVYGGLGAARRAHLHRRLADALDHLRDDDGLAGEVAHHLAVSLPDAAVLARLVDAAVRAGHYALERYDPEAAATHLRAALDALDRLGGGDPSTRAEALLLLARALQRTGAATAARQLCLEAAAIARTRGDAPALAAAALAFEEAAWTREGFVVEPAADGAGELLHGAITALGDTEPVLRGRLLARLPRVLCFREPVPVRQAFAARAQSLAASTRSGVLRGEALEARRWALWGSDDVDATLAVSDEMVVVASAMDDALLLTRANIWRYLALLEKGDLGAVDDTIATLHDLGERYRDPMALWFPAMARAMRDLLTGRLTRAEAHATEALVVAQRLDLQWAVTNFGIQLAYIRREQDRLGELEEATSAVAARFDAPVWHAALADLYCVTGRADAAQPVFERLAKKGFADVPEDPGWIVTLTVLADVCAELGDVDRAAILYGLLAPHAGRIVVIGPGVVCAGSAARAAGRLAALVGRGDDADAHLAEAVRANIALGAAPALAHTHLAWAETARRRDEDDTAHTAAALAIADELDLPLVRRLASTSARYQEDRDG
jgi:tetratricopeptide (TPR) repeat protein